MGLVLLLWLCCSGGCDFFFKKCFNWIAIFGGLMAILAISLSPESHPVGISFKDSILGAVAAFIALITFYAMKMMGAGDVKFATVLGLWVGWKLLLPIWVLSCLFAVAHGLFARSFLKYFFVTTSSMEDGMLGSNRKFIPYVTYLSLASIIVIEFYKNQ